MFLQELTQQALLSKREKKAFEIFLNNAKYQHASERLGTSFNVTDSFFECLEGSVCRLNGQSCSNINQASYKFFCTKSFNKHRLATRQTALLLHTYPANYETAIDRRAIKPFMNAPTPHEKGWIISFNEFSIRRVTRNQAPTKLMKHLPGKCKRIH